MASGLGRSRKKRVQVVYHCAAAALLKGIRGQSGGTVGISTGNEIRRVPGGQTYQPWGMLAAIDLHGCERRRLGDPGTLRRFVPSLINAIGMRAHGPLMLDRFGDGELEGWSAMQFIETSSVTVRPVFRGRLLLPAVRLQRRGRGRGRALRRHVHAEGASPMTYIALALGLLAGVVGIADTIPP